MGSVSAKLLDGVEREARILVVGLERVGKRTILAKMRIGDIANLRELEAPFPMVEFKNIDFLVRDVSIGERKLQQLWHHYLQNAQGLIYVVDSNDRDRISEAAEELQKMLKEDELRGVPLLVFANKQDLPNALSVSEVTNKLGLHSIGDRKWYIQSTCATSGDGLHEGLDWIMTTLAGK